MRNASLIHASYQTSRDHPIKKVIQVHCRKKLAVKFKQMPKEHTFYKSKPFSNSIDNEVGHGLSSRSLSEEARFLYTGSTLTVKCGSLNL